MKLRSVHQLRLSAAVVGSGALIVLGGAAVIYNQGAEVTAAGNWSGPTTSTPPSKPAITKAVPAITGPAPLYAGEGPDSNPQAPIP